MSNITNSINNPTIAFIEGDGIGVDITPVMLKVVDAAVLQAYKTKRSITWQEVFAGEKAYHQVGEWLPAETLNAIRTHKIAIKGPLTTPVSQGFRSLNVSLRQQLDLYACIRPIRYFPGTPSPVKHPEKVEMVIFRENSEDIYTGIEWQAGSVQAKQMINYLANTMGVQSIRFPNCGIGIKPVSEAGSKRLVRAAIDFAIKNRQPSVTLVHKGNIMKFTEGAFKDWGYEVAIKEFEAKPLDGGPWHIIKHAGHEVIIKDVIADAFLQQILLKPEDYAVIATLNLNGDYISDALAAQVGGIGIAPGANVSNSMALFEATHGTAPRYAGQDKVNPSSLILSAEMMLRHLGWHEAANLILKGLTQTIKDKAVTYDFARSLPGATEVSCSKFGMHIIVNMQKN